MRVKKISQFAVAVNGNDKNLYTLRANEREKNNYHYCSH